VELSGVSEDVNENESAVFVSDVSDVILVIVDEIIEVGGLIE
jgi:hypothetical protein